jgi:hypothetical protein
MGTVLQFASNTIPLNVIISVDNELNCNIHNRASNEDPEG